MLQYLQNSDRYGLSGSRIFTFLFLAIFAAFFEGFGIAMFLPLLQFIEKGQDISLLAANSKMWQYLLQVFDFIDLDLSLVSLFGAVLALMLLRVVFMYLRQVYTVWLSTGILHRTRSLLFREYMAADYSYYSGLSSGAIINTLMTEVPRVSGLFSSLFSLVANSVVMGGYALVLLWLSPVMTLAAAVFLTIAGVTVNYYVRHTKKYSLKATEDNNRFSFLLLERLNAFRLMKLTATGERESDMVREASANARNTNFFLNKLNARVDLLLEPIVILFGLGIMYFSVTRFEMSLSQVGLFMLVLLRLLPLAKEFLRSRQGILSCLGSINVVSDAFRETAANRERQGAGKTLPPPTEGIALNDVSFVYRGQREPAIDHLSLLFPAGKMTALVGPSGSGKSTLADLLPMLLRPQSGEILIDGRSLDSFELKALRRSIAFVSQEAFIFNDTVRYNVAFAREEAEEAEIWDALEAAKAKDFVQSLPDGLQTILGERGTRLSGGQRQRLSLARALLQRAPILVLDEPTSALDSEVEKDIQLAINEIRRKNRVTIIVIAHRLSTIRESDKIVVLKDGKVLEEGSHEGLMVTHDWYARVSGMQNN